jgi:hypothetical protein
MAIVTIRAYSQSISGSKSTSEDVLVSVVEEDFWTAEYSLTLRTSSQGTDRIEVTCCFCAEEAYFLGHDREIVPLSAKASPPFPVGCILWLVERDILYQIDLPKYPHLRLCKKGTAVTAQFVIQDRWGSGLILWGDHKIEKSPIEKQIYVRVNRLKSLHEAVWLEPYPNGARAVICLTDHPDFDTVPKLKLLANVFSENNIRITKGVFPGSDPVEGKMEPGLDELDYRIYIDILYESGSEIAYHGVSPRTNPPPLSECLRRIDLMRRYSPKTWIDHGCGTYLFSKDAVFNEGAGLVDLLTKTGIENYWSYTDVWENPTRHLDVWRRRRLLSAFFNFFSFLLHKKRLSIPLIVYYGSSILKNLLGPFHIRPIINEPCRVSGWKFVAAHARRLNYYHENPMNVYDLAGQCSLMSKQKIWVFDTVLLNHLAFQLRPANIDLLCTQNGLLLAHCYFSHQKNKYGTMNCFVSDGNRASMIPEFIENARYISEKQKQKEVVTLPFNALRTALTNFVDASLIRTSRGWEIKGVNAIVASKQSASVLGPNKQWFKDNLYYTEVEERAVLRLTRCAFETG